MDQERMDWMVQEVRVGRMDRRSFIGRSMALGLTSVAAETLLVSSGIAAEPVQGGEVVVATSYSSSAETFDPTKVGSNTDFQRVYQVYNRLTNLDRDLNVVPSLAVTWEAANDATEWTFVLRDGVEFHNGKTLTSADVLFSLNEHIKEGSESSAKPLLSSITDMRADGDNVVRITLDSGNADFATLLGHSYQTSIVQEGWKDGDPVVGTGPYKLSEFTPGLESVTEKFSNYWNSEAGHVSTFITRGIPDNVARANALRSGDVDIMERVDPKVAGMMAQDPEVEIVSVPSGSWFAWVMMMDRAPTDDLNLRLALKHAVDRQSLVDRVLQGHGVVANDFPVNPGLPTYCHDIPQHDYDPDKARFYWDKTGLSSLEIAVSNAADVNAVDCTVVLQEQARAAGIDLVVNRVPDDGYWEQTWMQVPVCVTGWNSRPTADSILTVSLQCGGSWNESAWCNERFDELLVLGRKETDPARRLEIYCEACTILHDQGGLFVPYFTNYIDGTRRRVRNYHASSAAPMGASWPYEEIWVDETQA